jgi:hypothetical protein
MTSVNNRKDSGQGMGGSLSESEKSLPSISYHLILVDNILRQNMLNYNLLL